MPVPLVQIVPKILKSGQRVFKRGHWRVSESAYRSQQWRLKGGKAGTARRASGVREMESALRAELVAPPAGKEWVKIASAYPDRFEDYIDEIQGRYL